VMAMPAFGVIMLLLTGPATSIGYVVCALLILGFGYAVFSSPNSNAIMGSVSRQHYGVASSIVTTMRAVGMNMSMAVATVMISVFVGQAAIGPGNLPALLRAMRVCFGISIVLCCVGIVASLARGTVRKK